MKYFIILFLIIFIFVIYFQFYRKNVIFYSKKKSCRVLHKSIYFNNFNKKDLETRNLKNNKQDILKYYCSNLRDFNYNEKLSICWVIDIINNNLPRNKFLSQIWYFCKCENIEYNFPHTHNHCIFLPNIFVEGINIAYHKHSKISEMKNILNTLIHEKVHVFQRSHKYLFEKLYKQWNFIKGNIIDPYNYKKNVRNNPDSYKYDYIFSYKGDYIMMNAIFNKDAQNIGDIDNLGIYLEKINNNNFITTKKKEKLKKINHYNDFFGNVDNNYYEPNEISAELIAYYYLDKLGFDIQYKSQAYNILKKWINKYL